MPTSILFVNFASTSLQQWSLEFYPNEEDETGFSLKSLLLTWNFALNTLFTMLILLQHLSDEDTTFEPSCLWTYCSQGRLYILFNEESSDCSQKRSHPSACCWLRSASHSRSKSSLGPVFASRCLSRVACFSCACIAFKTSFSLSTGNLFR